MRFYASRGQTVGGITSGGLGSGYAGYDLLNVERRRRIFIGKHADEIITMTTRPQPLSGWGLKEIRQWTDTQAMDLHRKSVSPGVSLESR